MKNEEIDRIFKSFGLDYINDFWDNVNYYTTKLPTKTVQVLKDEKSYKLEFELPGFSKNDINISVDKNILKIDAKNPKRTYLKNLALTDNCDSDAITADLENGILYVEIPFKTKNETEKAIKINVK